VGRDEVILLDTHTIIWAARDPDKLGSKTRALISDALDNDQAAVSAITFWEIALLSAKGRMQTTSSVADLRREFVVGGGIELPITGDIAISSVGLTDLHGDPADRFIVATALAHDAILLTADKSLLKWKGRLERQDATK
jgi:PIN domain nuclease of toxin-antitoxin system